MRAILILLAALAIGLPASAATVTQGTVIGAAPQLVCSDLSNSAASCATDALAPATRVLFYIHAANMNTTADQAMTAYGATPAAWLVSSIIATNCSASPAGALGGVYTAASKGGTIIVAATQAYTGLATAAAVSPLTIGTGSLTTSGRLTATGLWLSLTSALGSAATCDLYVIGTGLP